MEAIKFINEIKVELAVFLSLLFLFFGFMEYMHQQKDRPQILLSNQITVPYLINNDVKYKLVDKAELRN